MHQNLNHNEWNEEPGVLLHDDDADVDDDFRLESFLITGARKKNVSASLLVKPLR